MIEASKIECPITKYPTAIRMQNIEGFLVNLEERNLHLGSRSNACRAKKPTTDNFKPEHVDNAAAPEMPDPKEKKFEAEYSESAQEASQTNFEEMSFMEKTKHWSTTFSCRVRITGPRNLDRLVKLLDRGVFTNNEYQCIIDQRFVTNTRTEVYWNVSPLHYQAEFDVRPKRTEKQLLNAFGIRALAVQVDMALAYFELKSVDMNCLNKGDAEEMSRRRVVLFEAMLRIQAEDTGKFVATTCADASVFWRWLTAMIPPALVERFIGTKGGPIMELELMDFELTLLMLIGELLKVCNDALRNDCMDLSQEVRPERCGDLCLH